MSVYSNLSSEVRRREEKEHFRVFFIAFHMDDLGSPEPKMAERRENHEYKI